MNMINREKFLKNCPETVGNILTGMEKCGELAFSELPEGNTVLVIVDVINGFVREGAMACADRKPDRRAYEDIYSKGHACCCFRRLPYRCFR